MNRKLVSKSNRVLRKILNKEENMDIFQDIVESILNIEIKHIELRKFLNNIDNIENCLPSEENFGVADVKATLDTGEEVNIGFQFLDGYFFRNKMLIYYAQVHLLQLKHDNSTEYKRTLTVNIIDDDIFDADYYHNVLNLRQKRNENYNEEIDRKLSSIQMHVIELGKFRKYHNKIEKKKDAWVAYLEGSNQELVNMAVSNFEKISKLDKLLDEYWDNEVME
jgi:predicted transposase/invertase (TIGR01784 family)